MIALKESLSVDQPKVYVMHGHRSMRRPQKGTTQDSPCHLGTREQRGGAVSEVRRQGRPSPYARPCCHVLQAAVLVTMEFTL